MLEVSNFTMTSYIIQHRCVSKHTSQPHFPPSQGSRQSVTSCNSTMAHALL